MARTTHIRLSCLLLLVAAAAVAKVTVSGEGTVFVGEQVQLKLSSDAGRIQVRKVPNIPGVRWLNNGKPHHEQNSMTIINGRRTVAITAVLTFIATRPGKITMPSITVTDPSGTVKTKPRVIDVRKRQHQVPDRDSMIQMKVTYNGDLKPSPAVYLGQDVALEITLLIYQKINLDTRVFETTRHLYPTLSIDNAVQREFTDNNGQKTKIKAIADTVLIPEDPNLPGHRYHRIRYSTTVAALQTGVMGGEVSHKIPILESNSDWFARQRQWYGISAEVPPVKVLALPPDTGDAGRDIGLIGDWAVAAEVTPEAVTVGDDVTLRLRVAGLGNIEGLVAPRLDDKLAGFKVYPPEIVSQPRRHGHRSSGVIQWVLVPVNANARLPELKFATFNTTSGKWVSASLQPQLTIKPGAYSGNGGSPLVDDHDRGTPAAALEDKHKATDILHIKQQPGGHVQLPLWRNVQAPVTVMAVAAPLVYLLVLLLAAQREKLAGSTTFRRRREAQKRRGQVFRKVAKASASDLPEVIRTELVPYLLAMLDLPPGTTITELKGKLNDPELAMMIECAEVGGFMPGSDAEIDPGALLQRVRKLAAILLLPLLVITAGGSEATGTFAEATRAYEQDRVADAESIYRDLQQAQAGNAALLYNLGNCAFRKGEYGQAIVLYERARRLAPRDSDIVENLNFVRQQVNLPKIGTSDDPLSLVVNLRDKLRPDEWLLAAGVVWCLCWLAFGVNRWRHGGFRVVAIVFAVLCLVALWAHMAQIQSTYRTANGAGVIVMHNTPLHRQPRMNSTTAESTLDTGTYITIAEQRTEWVRIRIDEAEGWVRRAAVEQIWER
ncbi:MAG: BatD family protein [Lentisphaeria bacterium]|jgi:tetratricopeptide (TPR) repeat protein|nr:BatD family protein [Lentisphaeria bacterium]MDP7739906.1 BatD family protein [Lentisphaeria bacterium]